MEYKNLVFTKHAEDRLKDRWITVDAIYDTVNHPDHSKQQLEQKTKFIKWVKQRQVQVVATFLPDQKKWLVISVWVRGEEDTIPLLWQVITLPFKTVWWIIKKLVTYR